VTNLIGSYLDKFSRMATLITMLFKHRIMIPAEKFEGSIITLFGKPIASKEANEIMLRMTEEFEKFIKRTEELTDLYLK